MTSILSQVPTATNSQILTVLIGGAALMWIVYICLCLVEKVRTMFSKDSYSSDALRISVDKLEKRLDHFEGEITQKLFDLNVSRERQAGELYTEIKGVLAEVNRVAQVVARLVGRIEGTEEGQ